jgi:hypothetical protein
MKFDSFKSEVLFNNNSKVIQENQMQQLDSCHHSQINRKIDVYLKDSLAIKAMYTIKICRYKELKTYIWLKEFILVES